MPGDLQSKRQSPLEQRLRLYRFAYVQIDPTRPFDPDILQLGLEWVGSEAGRVRWRAALGDLNSVNPLSSLPAISDSPSSLLKMRGIQPRRGLILCQTPFEPPFAVGILKRLVRKDRRIAPILWADDGTQRLFWGRPIASVPKKRIAPVLTSQRHPLYRLCISLREAHEPDVFRARFGIREDGRIEDQLPLFGPSKTYRTDTLESDLFVHDAVFRAILRPKRARTYVMSTSRTALAWFSRDMTRLTNPACRTLDFPTHPDPRDPHSFFVLVRDRSILFRRLNSDYAVIHLDRSPYRLAFRHYRLSAQAGVGWRSTRSILSQANLTCDRRAWVFQRTRRGWQSYLCHDPAAPDEQGACQSRFLVWRALRQS